MIEIIGTELNQWDTGRSVKVTGIEATHVHFANTGDSKAPIMQLYESMAKIPDYLLQTGKQLCVYAVANGVTIERKMFSVKKRERPENYVYDEDQRNFIYELIQSAEDATEGANNATEVASKAAQNADNSSALALESASRASEAAEDAEKASANANEAAAKASQTAKSLMVVGKAEGSSIYLDDAIEQYLVGLRVFGKTTQDGTPTPDAPVELVSAGDSGAVTVIVAGKNLLENTAVNNSNMNGVSFAVNDDRSITANGTAKADTYFVVNESVQLGNGEYYLTGCPVGGSATSYFLYISGLVQDFGNGARSELSGSHKIGICIKANATVSNLTFYPMIRPVSVTDGTYEPYKGKTLAISTPNGLPGIPVTSGGNYIDASGQQWVCDEIDLAKGVHIHRLGKWVINGSAKPNVLADGNNGGTVLAYLYTDVMSGISTNRVPKMCDKLQSPTTAYPGSYKDCEVGFWSFNTAGGTTPDMFLVFNVGKFSTEDEASNYLLKNPLTFIGILATPVEAPLSEEELATYDTLHTYRNHTTVSNDASAHMELEYAMDAKKYIDSLIGSGGASARLASVTLRASAWTGADSLFSQVVTVAGVTPYSKVDLLPSVEQLAIFYNKDVTFLTENEGGVVTVYAIGEKPVQDYTMQVQITEVVV